jgi:uncharacterized protein (TIRG00374 family)
MKNKKKYILSFSFFLLMLIITAYVIFKNNSLKEIRDVFKKTNRIYIILGLGMGLIFFGIQGYYLMLILKHLGKKVTYLKGIVYSCIEYYFSGITPSSSGGQPVQVYYMRKDKISVGKSSIVVLLTTIIYKFALIIFGVIAVIFKSSLILSNGKVFNIVFFFGVLADIVVIAGCIFLMFSKNIVRNFLIKCVHILEKLKISKYPDRLIEKLDKHLEEYSLGAKYIKENIKLSIVTFILTLIQRLAMFSVGFFVYKAIGLSGYSYFDLIAIQIAISIAMDLLPFPGGIGISEVMLLLIYKKIFGEDIAISAMLITRCIGFYFALLLSSIATVINHTFTMKRDRKEELEKEMMKEQNEEEKIK